MSRTQTNAVSQTAPSTSQTAGKQLGVIPNFHHVLPSSPAALESYIHLYLDGMAKSGLDGAGGRKA